MYSYTDKNRIKNDKYGSKTYYCANNVTIFKIIKQNTKNILYTIYLIYFLATPFLLTGLNVNILKTNLIIVLTELID